MTNRRAFHLCLLSLGLTGCFVALLAWPALQKRTEMAAWEQRVATWELRAGDLLARYGRKTPPNEKIVFLAIDSESMGIEPGEDLVDLFGVTEKESEEARALEMIAHEWPWPRSVYAMVLERLCRAGAAVVVFDMNFPTPAEQDPIFRASLEKYRDRVVLGSYFVDWERQGVSNPNAFHKGPTETLIAASNEQDPRVGFTNFASDLDGVVRDATFQASILTLSGWSVPDDVLSSSLAAQAVRRLGRGERVPRDTAPHTLRLTGEPGKGFPAHSIFEIFVPEYWKRNYRGGELFRGAVVVIGAAGNWQHDVHTTALSVMPGPELQCNTINALLQGGFVQRGSLQAAIALIVGAGLGALALGLLVISPVGRLLLLIAAAGGYVASALYMYNAADLLLPLVFPTATLLANAAGGLLYDLVAVRQERRRLRTTFERYVSKNVVGELMEDSRSYLHSLGGELRPVTILFSDIRNFTRVCAVTEPTLLVQLLNEYLTVMVDCAFRHGGTLDKFIGDAIMVVWGNVQSAGVQEDARRAVRCALAMQEELRKLNTRWEREGRNPFHIGIALNHGSVVAGSIGSPHRMEVTVIGDAVNVCWRLQERTKLHAGGLILGETMVPLLGDEYRMVPIGTVTVGETLDSEYFCLVQHAEPARERLRHLVPATV